MNSAFRAANPREAMQYDMAIGFVLRDIERRCPLPQVPDCGLASLTALNRQCQNPVPAAGGHCVTEALDYFFRKP